MFQAQMKSLDQTPGSEPTRQSNNWERENQSETSHNKSPLLAAQMKPCRQTRTIVKGQTEGENH